MNPPPDAPQLPPCTCDAGGYLKHHPYCPRAERPAVPVKAGELKMPRPAWLSPPSHDWPEDFHHENGQYYNNCKQCGAQFVGHKRRPVCKFCAEPPVTDTQRPDSEQSAFERWLARCSPSGDAESVHRQWLESSDYADSQRETPRKIAEKMYIALRCSWYAMIKFAEADCEREIKLAKTAFTEFEALGPHVAEKDADLAAAKQDSERLEWLLANGFVRGPLNDWLQDRAEIDDAMREGEG